jgi:hypothetical protein
MLQYHNIPPRNLYHCLYTKTALIDQYSSDSMYTPVIITGLSSDPTIAPPPLRQIVGRTQVKRRKAGSQAALTQESLTQDNQGNTAFKTRLCNYCGYSSINNHNSRTCPKRKRDADGEQGDGAISDEELSDDGNEARPFQGQEASDAVKAYFQSRLGLEYAQYDPEESDGSDTISGGSDHQSIDNGNGADHQSINNDNGFDHHIISNDAHISRNISGDTRNGEDGEIAAANLVAEVLANETHRQLIRQGAAKRYDQSHRTRAPATTLSVHAAMSGPVRQQRLAQAVRQEASMPRVTRFRRIQEVAVRSQESDVEMRAAGYTWCKGSGKGMYGKGYWDKIEMR